MRFDDNFLDEIKSRLRLSDVIGRTVKLRRQGREYAGLSPFTKEKSPSFFVNDDKGFYHCFSSGKHGDLISFLQETERLSFPEAVERLAAEAGVPMPAQDSRSAEEDRKRASLGDWLEMAAKWFEAELRRPAGREARAYLERRGLPESEWARFRMGFSPQGRTALKDYLVAKGAQPAALVEAGLLIAPEDGGAPYDRFRDRVIFPIADARGRVVSFGSRSRSRTNSASTKGVVWASWALSAAGPCSRRTSSGSLPPETMANLKLRPALSRGRARSMARLAARRPALSPSKHRVGSACERHSSSICSSVRAVPIGATAATPARWQAMTSI